MKKIKKSSTAAAGEIQLNNNKFTFGVNMQQPYNQNESIGQQHF